MAWCERAGRPRWISFMSRHCKRYVALRNLEKPATLAMKRNATERFPTWRVYLMRYLKSLAAIIAVVAAAAVMAGAAIATSGSAGADSATVRSLPPLEARVVSPKPTARAGVNGQFTVDLSLRARTRSANRLLTGYTTHFIDPNSSEFHPGPNASAPGLVVLLSTTPTIAGTPLQGPKTNLAGVFQINDISRLNGKKRSFNSWIISAPGFFGHGHNAKLPVYAVRGRAPAVVTGDEHPISNVVKETFRIAR